jgi:hypothetical protein
MRVFFNKMGIEKVRFKPAYNPYTEVRPPFVPSQLKSNTSTRRNTAFIRNLRFPPHARPLGRSRQ